MGFDSLASNIITGFLLLVLLIAVMAPAYWLMKKLGYLDRPDGRKTTMGEDLAELFASWRANSGQSTFRTGYRYFLCFAIVVATGWVAHQLGRFSDDPNSGFFQFYYGCGYLLFLGWCFTQFRTTAKPTAGHGDAGAEVDGELSASLDPLYAGEEWSRIEVPNQGEIDDSKLSVAQAYLSAGESFDSVCGLLDPEFRTWDADKKAAYRQTVKARLAALRPVEDDER